MKSKLYTVLCFLALLGCTKPKQVSLRFLDEYVVRENLDQDGYKIGGLSGVDYANDTLYFVVDDSQHPRLVLGTIDVRDNKIDTVLFHRTILVNDSLNPVLSNEFLDLESVFVDEKTGRIHLTSEGSINQHKKPMVFSLSPSGQDIHLYPLPDYLENPKNQHHNKSFEASSKTLDQKGFWFTAEAPLQNDGDLASFESTHSPIRFSYYDWEEQKITRQYAYPLGNIDLKPKGDVVINGVTAIMAIGRAKFLVIERAYVSGYGSYGNVVKIFLATIEKESTNTKDIPALANAQYQPMKKELLLNLNDIKGRLTDGIIDNIEGITWGPKLPNGNKSLILVADDNFQKFGKQLNQFIFLELIVN